MTERLQIIAADSDLEHLDVLKQHLSDDYDLICLNSGEDCLNHINNASAKKLAPPFLIILGVDLDKKDGYKTCKIIKRNPSTKLTRIIFTSSHVLAEDHIKAYKAGADDYINKPIDKEEIRLKIKLIEKDYKDQFKKDEELNNALATAMRSTLQASETGVILESMYDFFKLDNNEAIAKNVLDACHIYGLNVIVTIDLDSNSSAMISSKGRIKPIELELIKNVRSQGDIFHFDRRTVFNYASLSILVLNMPVDSESEYSRVIEHLAIIAKGAGTRVQAINIDKRQNSQRLKLIQLVDVVEELISSLETSQKQHQLEHTEIVNLMMDRIQESFISMDLSEQQEDLFNSIIKSTEDRVALLFDKGTDLQEKLTSIKMLLKLSSQL